MEKSNWKRFSAVIMTLCLVLTWIPGSVYAQASAEITDISITVDGATYTEGNVAITSSSTVSFQFGGTNLDKLASNSFVFYAWGTVASFISEDTVFDGTTKMTVSVPAEDFRSLIDPFEIQYSLDGETLIGTGIYVVYDTQGSDARITGLKLTIDETEYSSGKVTVKPTDQVMFTILGENLNNINANCSLNNELCLDLTLSENWSFSADGTAMSGTFGATLFENVTSETELIYTNDQGETWTGTGIYVTFDNGTAETDKAQITGVTAVVDGVAYTSGNVIVTPTSTIGFEVTGENFASLSTDNVLSHTPELSSFVLQNYGWNIDVDANSARVNLSDRISNFENCDGYEVRFSNDGQTTWIGTGIYLTYDVNAVPETKPETTTIYFNNTAGWETVAGYYWGHIGRVPEWPGDTLEHLEGNIWSLEIPVGATIVVFTDLSSMTDELTIPTDGKNLYHFDTETWSVYGENQGIPGDFNEDGEVNNDDVLKLLWHTLFPEDYALTLSGDINKDGEVNNEDVQILLWHTLFPEEKPL